MKRFKLDEERPTTSATGITTFPSGEGGGHLGGMDSPPPEDDEGCWGDMDNDSGQGDGEEVCGDYEGDVELELALDIGGLSQEPERSMSSGSCSGYDHDPDKRKKTVPNSGGGMGGEYPCQVLSTSEILQLMIDCIREGNGILQLAPTTVRLLLNHFGWDKERLLEAYCERDQEELFREAGVFVGEPGSSSKNGEGEGEGAGATPASEVNVNGGGGEGGDGDGEEECGVCFGQVPSSNMFGIECGHRFCNECWTAYFTTKIMEEGIGGQIITCAAHKCPNYVDDATIMKLVTDPKVQLKYQHLISNSFVQSNRLMRWCPSAGCTNAIRVQWVDSLPVSCSCGHTFCFSCGHNWHAPVKCGWLKLWLDKSQADSGNSKWIAANTKPCPKCGVDIEKNGGCNRMQCTNQNCNYSFCWLCMGPWDRHGYNPCNRYDEGKAKEDEDARQKTRTALKRYVFYFDRYMGHRQSLRLEQKLYTSIEDKMKEMMQHNMTWIDVQFLRKAVDILRDCRRALMYTYVFAFYLKTNNQSEIFEQNQRDLQNATETLSEYMERDITSEVLDDIRAKVQDKATYCEGRSKALLEHVREGYEKDWWLYTEETEEAQPQPVSKSKKKLLKK